MASIKIEDMDNETFSLFVDFLKREKVGHFERNMRIFRVFGCRSVFNHFRYPIAEESVRSVESYCAEVIERINGKTRKGKLHIEDVTNSYLEKFHALYFSKR